MAGKGSRRYQQCLEKVPAVAVSVTEAVTVIKEFKTNKFDPTIEMSMHLGIDPRQADQQIRGAISLPSGIGASRKVIAFCDGDNVEKATAAGAIEAGSDELIKKIQGGWMDFDVAVATPDMMKDVSRLGRVLGPQGKMPSPKAGTVGPDISQMVTDYAAGKVEYRNDDGGNLHVIVGKASFEQDKLIANIEFFIKHIKHLRPASTKGVFMKKVCISGTMSPSVQIDIS